MQHASLWIATVALRILMQSQAISHVSDCEDVSFMQNSATLSQRHRFGATPQAAKKESYVEYSVISETRIAPSIPRQLVMTGKSQSIEDLPAPVRANVERALQLNRDLRLRYLSDSDCFTFLKRHQQELGLLEPFEHEKRGSLRGDLCRTAVLLVEGGFYQDLDVQLKVPFHDLVGAQTSFMTVVPAAATPEQVGLLNAVIGATPQSSILNETVREMREWYSDTSTQRHRISESDNRTTWMGPMCLYRGLSSVMKAACPGITWLGMEAEIEWACGPHTVRLYKEVVLDCAANPNHCPDGRATGAELVQYGLVKPEHTQSDDSLIGWSRFADCKAWGCGGDGYKLSSWTQ
jgi:hypothetical protein